MIIQEPDYFLLVDHYQLIYVAIMQAYGNNIITIYCLNIICSILLLHKIFLPTMDKIFRYFVSGILESLKTKYKILNNIIVEAS